SGNYASNYKFYKDMLRSRYFNQKATFRKNLSCSPAESSKIRLINASRGAHKVRRETQGRAAVPEGVLPHLMPVALPLFATSPRHEKEKRSLS
ncbi:MAG: hypothetical protein QW568_05415, partial [Candidatus Anstonellaceae archaeon]